MSVLMKPILLTFGLKNCTIHHLAIRCIHNSPGPIKKKRKAVVWTRFEQENHQIYGPPLLSEDEKGLNQDEDLIGTIKTIQKPRRINRIHQLTECLEMLPNSNDYGKFANFPVFNPWRSRGATKNSSSESSSAKEEEEFLLKRKTILKQHELKTTEFPSVTKIISATMPSSSRQALDLWKGRMLEKLGKEGFEEYQQNIFRRGHLLHHNIAKRLEEKFDHVSIGPDIAGYWKSLAHVFTHISDVKLLEKPVVHPFLCYRGIIDCVAHYQKNLYLIDWKTSSRPKPSMSYLYDEPLQVIAYLGALNYDINFDYQVNRAAVIVAYEDGYPAHVHRISDSLCETYWAAWVKRLEQFWSSKTKLTKDSSDSQQDGL